MDEKNSLTHRPAHQSKRLGETVPTVYRTPAAEIMNLALAHTGRTTPTRRATWRVSKTSMSGFIKHYRFVSFRFVPGSFRHAVNFSLKITRVSSG